MSSVYNGVAGNVTPPTALTITNVTTAATPTITVSTPLPASIVTTFTVDITGVQGASLVNGTWTATKTGPSTFTVPSGAPSAYTTGGSAQPILLQGITIPSDGDTRSASSVNTPLESLQDQIAYLALISGQSKIVQYFSFNVAFSLNSLVASCPNTTGGTWADWTGTLAADMPFASADSTLINVIGGDVVRLTFQSNLLGSAANNCGVALWYANYQPGVAPVYIQANGNGAQLRVESPPAAAHLVPFTLSANVNIGSTGLFDFKVRLITTANASANDFELIGVWSAEAIVYRPNSSVPQ